MKHLKNFNTYILENTNGLDYNDVKLDIENILLDIEDIGVTCSVLKYNTYFTISLYFKTYNKSSSKNNDLMLNTLIRMDKYINENSDLRFLVVDIIFSKNSKLIGQPISSSSSQGIYNINKLGEIIERIDDIEMIQLTYVSKKLIEKKGPVIPRSILVE